MNVDNQTERPELRSIGEIFEDLRVLVQSDTAIHEISGLIYRDHFVTLDRHDARVVDDPEHRWSTSKLNLNEIMLLLGLMVQSPVEATSAVRSADDDFATCADSLLHELHNRVAADAVSTFDVTTNSIVEQVNSIGLVAREAIYYGATGFYQHQFLKFGRKRYREDTDWLLQNIGISIRPMLEIAKFILDRINTKITDVGHLREKGRIFSKHELTDSLLIMKEDVRNTFGAKCDAFFSKFVTPLTEANKQFTDPFAINSVALAPIIEMGNYLYVPLQYRLCESIYESPFFWMIGDHRYAHIQAEHRGAFVERTAADILCSVFGAENVHKNVVVSRSARERGGEIDVLVFYGEFVIVVQAKSKRITLKARAGNADALKTDFKGAVQDPYKQALDCIGLIKAGAKCIAENGNELELHTFPRFFPMVVLSDSFPASTMLSRSMLQKIDEVAPAIWDIGVLDCVTRLLPSPIELLFYLKCRSDAFDQIVSDSEYTYLGYHIRSKLALPAESDMLLLERDFATVVDDFMVAADVGIEANRPVDILEQVKIPVVSDLLIELRKAGPRVASVVIDLYNFSSAALEDISATVLNIRKELAATGKAIKAFSIRTESGGLTYAVTLRRDSMATEAAQAIGAKHKYDTKSDRWYVVLDSMETENPIDSLEALVWPWVEDKDEEKASERVATMFNSSLREMTVGAAAKRRSILSGSKSTRSGERQADSGVDSR